jgi:hypothetical protein
VPGTWLDAAIAELEAATDASLGLTREEVDELLRLASFAAHESDARVNAPLVCYAVGRAAEASGRSVAELARVVREASIVAR